MIGKTLGLFCGGSFVPDLYFAVVLGTFRGFNSCIQLLLTTHRGHVKEQTVGTDPILFFFLGCLVHKLFKNEIKGSFFFF